MDLPLARTAASLEQLAVDTYNTAIKSGLVKTAAIGSAAGLFRDHHQMHLDALNSTIANAGGTKVTVANKAVYDALIAPAVAKLKDEAGVVALALAARAGRGPDLRLRRWGAQHPGAALHDHDDRRHRGPSRHDPHDGGAEEDAVRRLPVQACVLPG